MPDAITAPPPAEMTGLQRAAIFLLSLGEKEASDVLKHIGAKEVQKLGQAMASLGSVSAPQANQVIDRFINELGDQTSLGVGADDYVRKVLVGALGEDKASGLIDRILLGRSSPSCSRTSMPTRPPRCSKHCPNGRAPTW